MMAYPLTMKMLLERAESLFPKKEIVSRTETGIRRYTYAEYGERTRRLSTALSQLGVGFGDRVATFAWNHHRHLEAYFAIPCMGATLHTLNIRLSADHLAYIINHARDKVVLVDEALLPLIEQIQDRIPSVEAFVVMRDSTFGQPLATSLSPAYDYETLLAESEPMVSYRDDLDENATMGICYTSATTGNPKGVAYSHRAIVLHSFSIGLADTIGLSESDCVLPIVPMFHANAWGLPFASVWFGTKQVLPGPSPTPDILLSLMEEEQVSVAGGVPTVWLGVAKTLESRPRDLHLRMVICGGSAAPRGLVETYEQKFGIPFVHAYGMTETSPLASVSRLKSYQLNLSHDEQLDIRLKQGLLVPGIEMKVVGPSGDVAWNGEEMGELCLRGPWVANEYMNDARSADAFRNGWLHTGDVAKVDPEGFIQLVDRTKDVIKSGGEWISSMDLENALMSHPDVFEAAVVGVPHPKWVERPLAFVVLKEAVGAENSVAGGVNGGGASEMEDTKKQELLTFLESRFAKWWVPDDLLFIHEIPKTTVGKFLKRALRETHQGHYSERA